MLGLHLVLVVSSTLVVSKSPLSGLVNDPTRADCLAAHGRRPLVELAWRALQADLSVNAAQYALLAKPPAALAWIKAETLEYALC